MLHRLEQILHRAWQLPSNPSATSATNSTTNSAASDPASITSSCHCKFHRNCQGDQYDVWCQSAQLRQQQFRRCFGRCDDQS